MNRDVATLHCAKASDLFRSQATAELPRFFDLNICMEMSRKRNGRRDER